MMIIINIFKEMFSSRLRLRSFSVKLINKRFESSSIHDMQIDYLKQTFEDFNFLDTSNLTKSFDFKKSAVLVPISVSLEKNKNGHFFQQSYFTLTKRSENLKKHKGQVAFPGGMVDVNDKNIIETALREANEEIGIKKENVHLIAQTIPMTTTSRTLVYPVIVFFDDADFKPIINKDEVDHVFKIPTIRFIEKENHEHKLIKLRNGDEYYVHYFKDTINGLEIQTWGLTALICIITSTILHSRAPEFTVDPKFDFNKLRFKKKINEYLKYILAKNAEIVNAYNQTKKT